MKKNIILFLALLALVGCKKKYEEGYSDGLVEGQADGKTDGYADGFDQGFADGYDSVYDTAYNEGMADGHDLGLSDGQAYYSAAGYDHGVIDGYDDGYIAGDADGYADGYDQGFDEQYGVGYDAGYTPGYNDGADDGYSNGYSHGDSDGYDDGYDSRYSSGYWSGSWDGDSDGYDDGYDDGWDDGYDDGAYDYDMGYAAKSSNPAVKMAAMVNADLIDYANLQKFDASSATGSIAMNHADSGTVDMEKIASLKEQHFLNQMSLQIRARYGLSAERSKEIATVAHQFNKLAGTRELTEKDANVFAVEIIGKNLKDVEAAVEKSLKGDSAELNHLLGEIAGHNQTTPENVNKIIGEIFF